MFVIHLPKQSYSLSLFRFARMKYDRSRNSSQYHHDPQLLQVDYPEAASCISEDITFKRGCDTVSTTVAAWKSKFLGGPVTVNKQRSRLKSCGAMNQDDRDSSIYNASSSQKEDGGTFTICFLAPPFGSLFFIPNSIKLIVHI